MADRVVPFDDACRMVEMAQAAGWPVRFVSIEGGDHSFSHAFCRECAIEESGSWFASILGKEHGSSW
jgi:dipeptidyl aminopeptidase/acylaminoacyl peptidase